MRVKHAGGVIREEIRVEKNKGSFKELSLAVF